MKILFKWSYIGLFYKTDECFCLKHQVNVFSISLCSDLNAQDVVILQNLRHYVFLIKVFACLRHCQTNVVGDVVSVETGVLLFKAEYVSLSKIVTLLTELIFLSKQYTGGPRYSRTQYPRFRLFAISVLFPKLGIHGF